MACDERWLFRMWHLSMFLLLLLFVSRNVATEVHTDSKSSINNETFITGLERSSKIPESSPRVAPTSLKSETLPNKSNPLINDTKLPTEVTKPSKEILASQSVTAENVPSIPPAKNLTVDESVKTVSTSNNKPETPQIKTPVISTIITTTTTTTTTTEVSTKDSNTKPGKTTIDQETKLSKGDDAPFSEDDEKDFHNPQLTNTDPDNYDEIDSPPKIDDDDGQVAQKEEEKNAGEGQAKEQTTGNRKQTTGSNEFDDGDSHFFIYFLTVVGMCIVMYVLFHNKQKILALIVEGRQERRRRPNTNQYRPLDNNLEEVIQAGTPKNGRLTTNIIY